MFGLASHGRTGDLLATGPKDGRGIGTYSDAAPVPARRCGAHLKQGLAGREVPQLSRFKAQRPIIAAAMMMPTGERVDHGASSKRMRAGTKSCSECRRRKVRCIYPENQAVCEACTLHGATCVAQQPKAATGVEAMKRRLEEMEQQLQQLGRSSRQQSRQSPDTNVYASTGHTSPFTDHSLPSFSGTGAVTPNFETSASDVSYTPNVHSGPESVLSNAPIARLLQDSRLMTADDAAQPADSLRPFMAEKRVASICEAGLSLLPSTENLDVMFNWTEKYWLIWPPCQYSTSPPDLLGPGKANQARQMILGGLASRDVGFAAKALSWLALCVQQASRTVVEQIQLPMPQADMVNICIDLVKSLLSLDDGSGGSLDGITSMNMLYKLYVNMGRPHKAWHWTRQGVSACVGLGLHRRVQASGSMESILWANTWMAERFMSHLLGLPSSVSATHAGISRECVGSSDREQVLWHFATAIGKIIDRDQLPHKSQYSTTVQISQELEEAKDLIPKDWWLPECQQVPVAELFSRQYAKVVYFVHMKLLHLPYMLKSVKEAKYRHSWDMAMDASRGAMEAYVFFREAPHATRDLCQQLDFQAFSCALVVIIGHMICPGRVTIDAKEADWSLVENVLFWMNRTVLDLDCPVAAQSARTLEVLNAARRGAFVSPSDYAVVIPYFGKIRINAQMATGATGPNPSKAPAQLLPTAMEFSTNEFLTENLWPMDIDLELEANWMDLSNFDPNIDWGQVFTSSEW